MTYRPGPTFKNPLKVVQLFSGGLDSTTLLYWQLFDPEAADHPGAMPHDAIEVQPVSVFYGQQHSIEVELSAGTLAAARNRIAEVWKKGDPTRIIHNPVDMQISFDWMEKIKHRSVRQVSLLDDQVAVPEERSLGEMKAEVPNTYVPFRNGIMLAQAAAFAEMLGADRIIGGWNAIDYSGYPDCRGAFLEAMEDAVNLGTTYGSSPKHLELMAPLLHLNKRDIIRLGLKNHADYSFSYSCYRGNRLPCTTCDSCKLRANGWKEAGVEDHYLTQLRKELNGSATHEPVE